MSQGSNKKRTRLAKPPGLLPADYRLIAKLLLAGVPCKSAKEENDRRTYAAFFESLSKWVHYVD